MAANVTDADLKDCSNDFSVIYDDVKEKKRYQCNICRRHLASKYSVLYHLHSAHNKSPVKRVNKKYVFDDSIEIPKSTMYRKRKRNILDIESPKQTGTDVTVLCNLNDITDSMQNTDTGEVKNNFSGEHETAVCSDHDEIKTFSRHEIQNTLCNYDETSKSIDGENIQPISYDGNALNRQTLDMLDNEKELTSNEENRQSLFNENEQTSENESGCFSDCCFSELTSTEDSESELDNFTSDNDDENSVNETDKKNVSEKFTYLNDSLTETEKVELSLLSCFLGNKMSANSSKDVLKTFQKLFPNCADLQDIDYDHIWKCYDKNFSIEIHYCEICNGLFPDNLDHSTCPTSNCTGLRYKGINQRKKGRQPRAKFVFANLRRQFEYLLQSPGIWDNVQKNKELYSEKHRNTDTISDMNDGSLYKELLKDQNFLGGQNNSNLTVTFNTDGINLYRSSKIELWPIFLAVNELSPNLRFARQNVILTGIWQGKGKPPMDAFLKVFSEKMNDLHENGLTIKIKNKDVNVKVMVICGTCDLPAKASVLNMSLFNGSHSCITCEEPGTVVSQGKGHSRCFPHRKDAEKFPLRTEEMVRKAMENGTLKKRCKGFKGISSLSSLQGFCLVDGMVPDYMHCVLLGTTKNLLHKWFSPTENKKPYFIGDKLPMISRRLKNIKPPEFIERLPRNIEKNYANFKATELQSWLLYYSLPCLIGLLHEQYLNHFLLLSEGIYILLGDNITEQELKRADKLLDLFYEQFSQLYSHGSCGLNVHNIGCHLTQYVRKLGPLWSWSCFPFEDSNSMVLKTVHGTGNVMQQVMRIKEAEAHLRNNLKITESNKIWKKLTETSNCYMAGAVSNMTDDEHLPIILNKLEVANESKVKKSYRIMINGKRFYSESYSRMKNRICHVVLTDYENEEKPVLVKFYCMHEDEKIVYAVVNLIHYVNNVDERNLSCGKHLATVEVDESVQLICVDSFKENLFFIDGNQSDSCGNKYVVKMPNRHGHSVFK